MSVQDKLQNMLTGNESGTFLTKEKKMELEVINEAFFSTLGNLGGDLSRLSRGVKEKLVKPISKAIKSKLDKLDIEKFEKKMGINDIKDLDNTLSTMKVNTPDFYSLMKEIMLYTVQAKTKNKELYDSLTPIYDKHMRRLIDYYVYLITNAKDETQALMYYSILLDLMGWLDETRNKNLRDTIETSIADFMDKKSLEATKKEPDFKAALTPAEQDILKNIAEFEDGMTKLKVTDEEFFTMLKNIALTRAKIGKTNKDYDKINTVFNTNIERYMDFYESLLRGARDDDKALSYIGKLDSLLSFLSETDDKPTRETIREIKTRYMDRKTLQSMMGTALRGREEEPEEFGTDLNKEEKQFFRKYDDIPALSSADIRKMSPEDLKTFIKFVDNYEKDEPKYQSIGAVGKGGKMGEEGDLLQHLLALQKTAQKRLTGGMTGKPPAEKKPVRTI